MKHTHSESDPTYHLSPILIHKSYTGVMYPLHNPLHDYAYTVPILLRLIPFEIIQLFGDHLSKKRIPGCVRISSNPRPHMKYSTTDIWTVFSFSYPFPKCNTEGGIVGKRTTSKSWSCLSGCQKEFRRLVFGLETNTRTTHSHHCHSFRHHESDSTHYRRRSIIPLDDGTSLSLVPW